MNNGSLLLGLLVGKNLLQLLYLPIKALVMTIFKFSNNIVITMFCVNNMNVYKCIIYEIKKYSHVKVIFAFMIDPVTSCFLIHYIYATHAISVNVDDVRTRNRCFGS